MMTPTLAAVATLLAAPLPAQDAATASFIFGMRLSEAVQSAPIDIQDASGRYRVTAAETGVCVTTIRAGSRSWTLDWKTAQGVEEVESTFFVVHADPPVIFVVGEAVPDGPAKLEVVRLAMDRLWNNCE